MLFQMERWEGKVATSQNWFCTQSQLLQTNWICKIFLLAHTCLFWQEHFCSPKQPQAPVEKPVLWEPGARLSCAGAAGAQLCTPCPPQHLASPCFPTHVPELGKARSWSTGTHWKGKTRLLGCQGVGERLHEQCLLFCREVG